MTETKRQISPTIRIGIFLAMGLIALYALGGGFSARRTPPQAEPIEQPTASERITLVCDDCAAAGIDINLWSKACASAGDGQVVAQVMPNTPGDLLGEQYCSDQGRSWYQVGTTEGTGWVAELFVQR